MGGSDSDSDSSEDSNQESPSRSRLKIPRLWDNEDSDLITSMYIVEAFLNTARRHRQEFCKKFQLRHNLLDEARQLCGQLQTIVSRAKSVIAMGEEDDDEPTVTSRQSLGVPSDHQVVLLRQIIAAASPDRV